MAATEGLVQRKKSKAETTKTETVDKEDKAKPLSAPKKLVDPNREKNLATIVNYLVPMVLLVYLGVTLQKVSLAPYNDLITNRYLLLGFKNLDALKKALVDNMRDSAIWGLTYLYVRRLLNPEFRDTTWKYVQDGYFGSLSSFANTLLKQIIARF